MKNLKLLFVSVVLSFLFSDEVAGGIYAIIGARTVQQHSKYKCFLTGTGFTQRGENITVELFGQKNKFNETKTILLNKNFTGVPIEFDIAGAEISEDFTLTAKLTKEKAQKINIFTISKKYSVFIQTDKPVYKAGDEILYRILVLDQDLKPYEVTDIKHQIFDGNGNALPPKPEKNAEKSEAGEKSGSKEDSTEGDDDDDDDDDDSKKPNMFNRAKTSNDLETPASSNDADQETDEIGKLIDQDNGEITKGVYSYSYKITDEPIYGDWSIKVVVNGEKGFETTKDFEVKEYILPRYDVVIETKHDVQQSEGDITLDICGNYTFGELVSGTLKVEASVYDPDFPGIIHRTVSKTGIAEFHAIINFNIANELQILNSIKPYNVKFDVEFKETLTGQIMKKDTIVRVYRTNEYFINFVRKDKRFRPGFPYTFVVTVEKYDGTPVSHATRGIRLRIKYFKKAKRCSPVEEEHKLTSEHEYDREKLLKKGKAEFTLEDLDDVTGIVLTATYLESSAVLTIKRHPSKTDEYLIIKKKADKNKKSKKIVVGQMMSIEATFSLGVKQTVLYYVIFGRSGLIIGERKTVKILDRRTTISFKVKKEMAPACRVLVYYTETSGELIYDQMSFDVVSSSSHSLDLQFEHGTVMPGRNCTLGIETTPNSFVALLAVDKSVKLMGSGNDIDVTRVSSDLQTYDVPATVDNTDAIQEKIADLLESHVLLLTNAGNTPIADCFDERFNLDDGGKKLFNKDNADERIYGEVDQIATRPAGDVRQFFPETWMFNSFEYNPDGGYMKIITAAPHTITSYVVSAFAVHPEHGLAIAKPTELKVFKEFFLKLFVPFSMRMDEVLKVHVTVFNYLTGSKASIPVTIELEKSERFAFVDADLTRCRFSKSSNQAKRSKTITVPHGNGNSVFFLIQATEVGQIKLNVRATYSTHTDEVIRMVKVVREGIRKSNPYPFLIDLRDKRYDSYVFPVTRVEDPHIENTLHTSVSLIGDPLGPALMNIRNLIRKPGGCPEQMYATFMSNIAGMQYLEAIKQLSGSDRSSTEEHLRYGYQRLLQRKSEGGQFTVFGTSGVWMTTNIIRVLTKMKRVIAIDDRHIKEAMAYVRRFESAGSFKTTESSSFGMYGAYSNDANVNSMALSAFVAITFLEREATDRDSEENTLIRNILNAVKNNLSSISDNYVKAMYAYAFALNKDSKTAKEWLDDLAQDKTQIDNLVYWKHSIPAVMVETASYVVMANVTLGHHSGVANVINWMMAVRRETGGFHTTTDTVVGMQALAMYAAKVYSPSTNINVELTPKKGRAVRLNVNTANKFTLQVQDLAPEATEISLNATGAALTGNGIAYIQVVQSYHIVVDERQAQFDIRALPKLNGKTLDLEVCAKFIATGTLSQSGMTQVEIQLPSGFEQDPENAKTLIQGPVKQVEVLAKRTVVVLYLDKLGTSESCMYVKAFQKSTVFNMKKSAVKVHDYYNDELRSKSTFYDLNTQCGI